jgi:hypothetical protein
LVLFGIEIRAADYAATVLSDQPKAYYRLNDDTSRSPINKNSGSLGTAGNATNDLPTGVLHPFPGAIAGDGNRSEFFDFSTRTEIPWNAALNPPNTQPFTIEAWFYPASDQINGGQCPINNRYAPSGANRQGWVFFQRAPNADYNGKPGFEGVGWNCRMYRGSGSSSGLDVISQVPYEIGKWTHVAVVYDPVDPVTNATLTIYINGVAANTNAWTGGTTGTDPGYVANSNDHADAAAMLAIGNYNNTAGTSLNPYFGAVDEFALYSNKLSAAQILAHYQNGTNANRTTAYDALVKSLNPVAYLRLDEIAPGSDIAINMGDSRNSGNGTNRAGVRHVSTGALAGRGDAGAFSYQWRDGGGTTTQIPWTAGNNPDASIPFTFESWFRPTADRMNPGPSPVNNRLAGSAVNRTGWVIYQRDPNPTYVGVPGVGESAVGWAFRMYRGAGGSSSDVITQLPYNVGDWTHYVVTWEPTADNSGASGVSGQWEGTLTAYVNGVGVASNTAALYKANLGANEPPDDALAPADLAIGSYNAASNFGEELEGDIAELALYTNYVLTAEQILEHYRNGTNSQPATNYETLVLSAAYDGSGNQRLIPATYLRLNDPARYPAANSGTLGYVADGNLVSATNSSAGPQPPAYAGFEASNTALSLNGTNQWASLNNPSGLNFSGQITLEAWIKPGATQSDPARIISHGPPIPTQFDSTLLTVTGSMLSSNEVFLRIDGGGANYVVGSFDGTNTYKASYPVPAGDLGGANWIHLVGTYDGTNWRLYRNGTQVASAAAAVGALPVNGAGWAIGSTGSGGLPGEFAGGIDEVAIYNTALTPTKIATHYLIGKAGTASLTITKSGGSVTITWPLGTTLQESASLSSTFTDVAGSPTIPLVVTPSGTKFYRFRF